MIKWCAKCEHSPRLHATTSAVRWSGVGGDRLDRLFATLCSDVSSFMASGFSANVRPAILRSTVQALVDGGRQTQVADFVDAQIATRADDLVQRASRDDCRIEMLDAHEREFLSLSRRVAALGTWIFQSAQVGSVDETHRWTHGAVEICRARLQALCPTRIKDAGMRRHNVPAGLPCRKRAAQADSLASTLVCKLSERRGLATAQSAVRRPCFRGPEHRAQLDVRRGCKCVNRRELFRRTAFVSELCWCRR